jgi:hypothetical protein
MKRAIVLAVPRLLRCLQRRRRLASPLDKNVSMARGWGIGAELLYGAMALWPQARLATRGIPAADCRLRPQDAAIGHIAVGAAEEPAPA